MAYTSDLWAYDRVTSIAGGLAMRGNVLCVRSIEDISSRKGFPCARMQNRPSYRSVPLFQIHLCSRRLQGSDLVISLLGLVEIIPRK